MSEYIVIGTIIAAFAVAAVLSYFFTPPVKNFAHKVGAIDVPKDARRMHKKPIPRLGRSGHLRRLLCSILISGSLMRPCCASCSERPSLSHSAFSMMCWRLAKLKPWCRLWRAAIPVCIGDLQIGLFAI